MKTKSVIALLLLSLVWVGCENKNTYASLREQEKQTISDYIAREQLNILDQIPQKWGEKDYYRVPDWDDDFYLHVISIDSTARQVKTGDIILTRYKKYGLGAYSDTTRYWNTDDGGEPVQFQYGNTSDASYVKGWSAAMSVVKYSGSHCRIICPSKMGVKADNSSVTPYGYELKFTIKP